MEFSEIIYVIFILTQTIRVNTECADYYLAFSYDAEDNLNFFKSTPSEYDILLKESPDTYKEIKALEPCILYFECSGNVTNCPKALLHQENEVVTPNITATTQSATFTTSTNAPDKSETDTTLTATDGTTESIPNNSSTEATESSTELIIPIEPTNDEIDGLTNPEPKIYSEANGEVFLTYEKNCTNKSLVSVTNKCEKTINDKDEKRVVSIQCEYVNDPCSNSSERGFVGNAESRKSESDNNKLLGYIIVGVATAVAAAVLIYFIAKILGNTLKSGTYRMPEEQNAVYPEFNEDSV